VIGACSVLLNQCWIACDKVTEVERYVDADLVADHDGIVHCLMNKLLQKRDEAGCVNKCRRKCRWIGARIL
jgi:hypothetical protein